jgi:histone H3/H4
MALDVRVYDELRDYLSSFLECVLRDAHLYTAHARVGSQSELYGHVSRALAARGIVVCGTGVCGSGCFKSAGVNKPIASVELPAWMRDVPIVKAACAGAGASPDLDGRPEPEQALAVGPETLPLVQALPVNVAYDCGEEDEIDIPSRFVAPRCPASRAMRMVQEEQRKTGRVFAMGIMNGLVQEIAQDFLTSSPFVACFGVGDLGALALLDTALEHELVGLLIKANALARHGERSYVKLSDLQLVAHLARSRS